MKRIILFISLLCFISCLPQEDTGRETSKKILNMLKVENLYGMGLSDVIEKYGVPISVDDSVFSSNSFDRMSFDKAFGVKESISFTYKRSLSNSEQKKTSAICEVVILNFENKGFKNGTAPAFFVSYVAR